MCISILHGYMQCGCYINCQVCTALSKRCTYPLYKQHLGLFCECLSLSYVHIRSNLGYLRVRECCVYEPTHLGRFLLCFRLARKASNFFHNSSIFSSSRGKSYVSGTTVVILVNVQQCARGQSSGYLSANPYNMHMM